MTSRKNKISPSAWKILQVVEYKRAGAWAGSGNLSLDKNSFCWLLVSFTHREGHHKSDLPELHVFKTFCQRICLCDDIINLIAQCLWIKNIYNRICNKITSPNSDDVTSSQPELKGHSCGFILKPLHSWARWVGGLAGQPWAAGEPTSAWNTPCGLTSRACP